MLERQIIAVQDGNNKAAFGFYGVANKFGLKVAEDGVDVLPASDDQLVFNSEQNVFKIVDGPLTIDVSLPANSQTGAGGANATATTTINHNLGYLPVVLAFVGDSGFYEPLPFVSMSAGSDNFTSTNIKTTITSTQILFKSYRSIFKTGAGTASQAASDLPVTYYILQETAG
jgi:hypothetical protein